jgi:hypothetical protein
MPSWERFWFLIPLTFFTFVGLMLFIDARYGWLMRRLPHAETWRRRRDHDTSGRARGWFLVFGDEHAELNDRPLTVCIWIARLVIVAPLMVTLIVHFWQLY